MRAATWTRRGLLGLALLGALAPAARARGGEAPEPWLQVVDAAAAGWSPEGLAAARARAEELGAAAVMVVREGVVAVAWGDLERPLRCGAVRESLVSTLLGTALDDGALDLEATLEELALDDQPALSELERSATVRQLLTSRSGVYHPAAKESDEARAARPARGAHEPGARWWHNDWGCNALGEVYERATGDALFEAFARRIAAPIGMQDFRASDGFAELEPSRSRIPAHAFRMSTRDLARFGALVLNGGRWGGREVVPADWIEECTTAHSELDGEGGRGFGYRWWVYPAGGFGAETALPELDRYDKLAALGAGGQLLLIVPELELVIVHRADTDQGRAVDPDAAWALAEALVASIVCEPPAELELEPLESEPFEDAAPAPEEPRAYPIRPAELETCRGEYETAAGARIRVHSVAARLFLHDLERDRETELFLADDGRYFSRTQALVVEFEADGDAPARAVRGELGGSPFEARRLDG